MRRTLFLLALLAPVAARTQTPAEGALVNGTSGGDDGYINIAECSGVGDSGPVELLWNVKLESGTVTSGVFRVFATNDAGAPGATEPRYCETTRNESAATPIYTDQVGVDIATIVGRATGSLDAATAEIRAAATATTPAFNCGDDTRADQTITVCVHYHPNRADGTPEQNPTGWAVGSLVLSLRRPPAPESVSAQGGDGSLTVSWTAGTPTGAQVAPDSHRIILTPQGTGTPITVDATGSSRRVTGLENGRIYDVEVFGLSVAKNPSATSAATTGTPVPTDDFWDVYDGVEQGGCSAGASGPLALLGLAGLLAVLRRRK